MESIRSKLQTVKFKVMTFTIEELSRMSTKELIQKHSELSEFIESDLFSQVPEETRNDMMEDLYLFEKAITN